MRRVLVALGIVACVALGVTPAPATSASASPASAGSSAVVHKITARQFTATGIISRYYTRQTVTGTYRNAKGRPVDVTVYNWQGVALVHAARPALDPAWWGGYWHDTYGLDQWSVGTGSGMTFHFMLPPAPMGSTFRALLVTEFNGGGNWQNWMDGTSS